MQRIIVMAMLGALSLGLGGWTCGTLEDFLAGQIIVDSRVINSTADPEACWQKPAILVEAYGVHVACDAGGVIHITNVAPEGDTAKWLACQKFSYLLQGNAGQVAAWELACPDDAPVPPPVPIECSRRAWEDLGKPGDDYDRWRFLCERPTTCTRRMWEDAGKPGESFEVWNDSCENELTFDSQDPGPS